MDREEILRALTALAQKLDERGVVGEMYVVGGAAMALSYDARRSTRSAAHGRLSPLVVPLSRKEVSNGCDAGGR